jgi:hypothetical protein
MPAFPATPPAGVLASLVMNRVSLQSGWRGVGRSRRFALVASLVVLLGAAAIVAVVWRQRARAARAGGDVMSFDGDSGGLQRTQVVPTLDTPIVTGSNAVWCAAFELAWARLRKDVAGGGGLEGTGPAAAAGVIGRMNAAPDPMADLPAGSFYAAAGWSKDGVLGRIDREFRTAFPGATPPAFDGAAAGSDAAVAFAYLEAGITFPLPYFDDEDEGEGGDRAFAFRDASGRATRVRAFGVRAKDDYAYRELRAQPRVLFVDDGFEPQAFAIDLCRTSTPSQVVVARVERGVSLAATVAAVEERIAAAAAERGAAAARSTAGGHERGYGLGINDVMLVPRLSFRISHRFREIEGMRVAGPAGAGPIGEAAEVIRFKLDKGGMELKAEAKMRVKPMPTRYLVDRPFLVYAKRRDAGRPYFAAWVENAELLTAREGGPVHGTRAGK